MNQLTPRAAKQCVGELSLLRFFPADREARLALIEILVSMCEYEEQAQWLVQRMFQLYDEWPGPRELRAIYCRRYLPLDGIHATPAAGALSASEACPWCGCTVLSRYSGYCDKCRMPRDMAAAAAAAEAKGLAIGEGMPGETPPEPPVHAMVLHLSGMKRLK